MGGVETPGRTGAGAGRTADGGDAGADTEAVESFGEAEGSDWIAEGAVVTGVLGCLDVSPYSMTPIRIVAVARITIGPNPV